MSNIIEVTQNVQLPNPVLIDSFFSHQGRQIPTGKKALIDQNSGHLYQLVSPKYKLMRHEDAIGEFDQTLAKLDMGKIEADTTWTEKFGRIERRYTFKDQEVKIDGGDIVQPQIILKNSYDGIWSFQYEGGAWRFRCSNGLVIGDTFAKYKHKHSLNLEIQEQGILNAAEAINFEANNWRDWTGIEIEISEYEETLAALSLGKEAVTIIDSVIAKESNGVASIAHKDKDGEPLHRELAAINGVTRWHLYNGVTEYLTHHVKNLALRAAKEADYGKFLAAA